MIHRRKANDHIFQRVKAFETLVLDWLY